MKKIMPITMLYAQSWIIQTLGNWVQTPFRSWLLIRVSLWLSLGWTHTILQIGTDIMIHKRHLTRYSPSDFLTEVNGFRLDRNGGLMWYTNGSKTNEGTSAGVYGYGTRRGLASTVGNTNNTVFRAEVYSTLSRHVQSKI
jgi:hypothetical protein